MYVCLKISQYELSCNVCEEHIFFYLYVRLQAENGAILRLFF